MNVSFEEIGRVSATFRVDGCEAGQTVMVSDNGTVTVCEDGVPFCGVLEGARKGYGSVQLQGLVQVGYSGSAPGLGYMSLTGDGNGGIRSGNGVTRLVLSVDTVAKTCIIEL